MHVLPSDQTITLVPKAVGYEWIRSELGAPSFPGARGASGLQLAKQDACSARQAGGTSNEMSLGHAQVRPRLFDHIRFAIEHEGVDLFLLCIALRRIGASQLINAFLESPNDPTVRKACALWEMFNAGDLPRPAHPPIVGAIAPLFDPQDYVTGRSNVIDKWRVDFNGLGDASFCPVVRRTQDLSELLNTDPFGNLVAKLELIPASVRQALMPAAAARESVSSFDFGESAHTACDSLTAETLLEHAQRSPSLDWRIFDAMRAGKEIKGTTATREVVPPSAWRAGQKAPRRLGRGRSAFTCIGAPHEAVPSLMEGLLAFVNQPPNMDPLIHAAVASFGFAIVQPLGSGNSQACRYITHHCLGRSGRLPVPAVPPILQAIALHESDFMNALASFGLPAETLCQFGWRGGNAFDCFWTSHADAAFRYPDATAWAEFMLRMGMTAMDVEPSRQIA